MKLLWVGCNFLHPTTKGGHIRTLEMLRELHRRHEIHYVALEDPQHPEGPARVSEYAARGYSIRFSPIDKRSPRFWWDLARSVADPLPLAITRYHVPALGRLVANLMEKERFDRAVCDFLNPATSFPNIEGAVLFQHNVETMIWRRLADHASNPLSRRYFTGQADRMFRFERDICLKAAHVVAVSRQDAETMRSLFGVQRVTAIPTGVDIARFTPPPHGPAITTDLVFLGSMDWLPNIDGAQWFVREVLPLIRRSLPECSVAIVGRKPAPAIIAMARHDPRIQVTGTVPDIRPHLWGSAVSIVPLRVGGGTRLKIYEAMAGRAPVVSTTIGAEGLDVHPPEDIRLADSAEDFAAACVELLSDAGLRRRQSAAAWEMVSANFSWERVARCFEQVLEAGVPLTAAKAQAAAKGGV